MNKYMGYEFRESMAFSHKTKKLNFFFNDEKKTCSRTKNCLITGYFIYVSGMERTSQ